MYSFILAKYYIHKCNFANKNLSFMFFPKIRYSTLKILNPALAEKLLKHFRCNF